MLIGIVDIGIGNLGSLKSALDKLKLDYKNCTENADFENIEKFYCLVSKLCRVYGGFGSKSLDKTIIKKLMKKLQFWEFVLVIKFFGEVMKELKPKA